MNADIETYRRRLKAALAEHHAQAALGIGTGIRSSLDILDVQPAQVIEAVLEAARELQKGSDAPRHRYKIRAAIIEYAEERLQVAREREDELFRAITELDEPPKRA